MNRKCIVECYQEAICFSPFPYISKSSSKRCEINAVAIPLEVLLGDGCKQKEKKFMQRVEISESLWSNEKGMGVVIGGRYGRGHNTNSKRKKAESHFWCHCFAKMVI